MGQGTMTLFKDFIRQMKGGLHDFDGGEDYKVTIINNTLVATEDDATPERADYTEVSGGGYAGIVIANDSWSYSDGIAYYVGDDPTWAQDGSGPIDCYQAIISINSSPYQCVGFVDLTVDGGTTPLSLQDGPIKLGWGGALLPGKIFKTERGS